MRERSMSVAVLLMILVAPATAHAAGAGDGSFPWVHWLVSMVNFAIFLGVIIYFAGPKVQHYFASRASTIKADIEDAKRLRDEAQAKLDEYSARLEKLDDERKALMDEYHRHGEREKDRLVADAKRQVEKLRADAEVVIAQEVRKAVAGLERQAVELAVNMARETLAKRLDEPTQNGLVDRYVDDLKSMEG